MTLTGSSTVTAHDAGFVSDLRAVASMVEDAKWPIPVGG